MASKRFSNLYKSKINSPNKSLTVSKVKQKLDSSEEPLIFDHLDSDHDSTKEKLDSIIVENEDVRNDDYEIVSNDTNVVNANPIRQRVGNVIKDCQSIFGTIVKAPPKNKSSRKPSEITKNKPKFPNFSRRKVSEPNDIVISEETGRSRSLTREEDQTKGDVEFSASNSVIQSALENEGYISDEPIKLTNAPERSITFEEAISESRTSPASSVSSDIISGQSVDVNTNYNINEDNTYNFSSIKILSIIVGILAIFCFFSISKFIFGLICGMLMSFGIFKIYESFFMHNEDEFHHIQNSHPRLRNYPNPLVPHIEERTLKDEFASSKSSYSTWVHVVNSYNPNWNNMSVAFPLHLSLESTKLRMRRPKQKISNRALVNESQLSGTIFNNERVVDLLHAKIHLLPFGLVRRRMWSKKYPVCISLHMNHSERHKRAQLTIAHSKSMDNLTLDNNMDNNIDTGAENLYFFARTCREKEEMFRRFMAASLGMPINLTISDIIDKYLSPESQQMSPVPLNSINELREDETFNTSPTNVLSSGLSGTSGSLQGNFKSRSEPNNKSRNIPSLNSNITTAKEPQIVTYVRYMAKFMPSDSFMLKMKGHNLPLNYVECDPELLWLNALIGRFAWDVFRGNFWLKVIKDKIQTKLKKIQLPYFIDQLEVTNIELGSELPVIRKVSRPYLDSRGLWIEFEVVYNGGFSMDLETKINLMRMKAQGAAAAAAASQHKSSSQRTTTGSFKYSNEVKFTPDPNELDGDIAVLEIPLARSDNPQIQVDNAQNNAETESCPDMSSSSVCLDAALNLSIPNQSSISIQPPMGAASILVNENTTSNSNFQLNSHQNNDANFNDKLRHSLFTGGGTVASKQQSHDPEQDYLTDDSYDSNFSESDEYYDKLNEGVSTGSNKSFISWLEKVTRSSYFQKASENKFVLKTMEYVSNTTLALQVNAHYLNGILVINIPPPPSDRLWWGFKKDPELSIKAKPKVGAKEIQMTKIVEFIEKKLIQEFRRVVVLPNMDDLAIPLLSSGNPDKYNQNLM